MAISTLANSPNPHHLFAEIGRLFAPLSHLKPQPQFRVFGSEEAEYHWRIAALATNETISRHKSLTFALRKCARLNEKHRKGARNETR